MAKKKFGVDQDLQGNKILNGGFEVVASLPTANNFVGRQVTYQGRNYIWNGSAWTCDSDTLDNKHYTDILLDIQNAKTENFGYRYAYDLVMYGDHYKYYPFVIAGGDQNVKRDILIKRSYSELHPPEWYSATHGGGLTLKIRTNFGDWGGANYGWEIHELEQMYNETFAGAETTTSYMTFSIFLRGGGTGGVIYHIYSNQPIEVNHPLHIEGQGTTGNFPMVFYNAETVRYATSQYTWAMPAYRATPSTEEIRIRNFIKLSQNNDAILASHNHNTAYLGITAKAVDSDKLDGKHASDFATSTQGTKADTALQSITKIMVEAVLTGIITSHQHNYTTSTDVSNLINTAIASVYKPKGNIANKTALLALTNIKQGDVYNAQLAFTLNGQNVKAGDNIVCLADAATSTETNWDNLGGNIDFAAALSQALIGFSATSGNITSSDTILSAINKLAYDKHIHSNSTALNAVSGTNTGDENTTRIGRLINEATAKTTPVDNDMVGLMDSAAGNILKKLSWARIKATLKAYFDTMYTQLSFSKIKVGGVDIAASANDDIIEFIAGTNVTLTPDAGGKKLTIATSAASQSQIDSLVNTVNSKQDKVSILPDINIVSNGSENITPGDNQIQYINLSGATTIHTINLNYYRNSTEEYTMIIVNPNAASRITLNTHASYKFVGVLPSWSFNSWVICIWKGMIFANVLN